MTGLFSKVIDNAGEKRFFDTKNHKHEVCGFRAIDGTRTRDFHLGKVALYQLSHYRILPIRNGQVILYHKLLRLSI